MKPRSWTLVPGLPRFRLFSPLRGYCAAAYAVSLYGSSVLFLALLVVTDIPFTSRWQALLLFDVVQAPLWFFLICSTRPAGMRLLASLLPACCSLYTTVPVAILVFGFDIFPFPIEAVKRGMVLQSAAAMHFWLFAWLLFPNRLMRDVQRRLSLWMASLRFGNAGLWFLALLGLAIACAYLANFYLSGTAAMLSDFDRVGLTKQIETGKTWLLQYAFAAWMMVYATIFLSSKSAVLTNKTRLGVIGAATVIFLVPYLRIGNRREIVLAAIYGMLLLLVRGNRNAARWLVGLGVPGLLLISAARALAVADVSSVELVIMLQRAFGEFIFAHYPLLWTISSHPDPLLGASYFHALASYVPTFGLWSKAQSLALIFANTYDPGGMGYGYTPLGEGYANFGSLSAILVPALLAVAGRALLMLRRRTLLPFLVFASMSMDINRSESMSILGELLIFFCCVSAMLRLAQCRVVHAGA